MAYNIFNLIKSFCSSDLFRIFFSVFVAEWCFIVIYSLSRGGGRFD